jgi:hypothetical protein
VAVTNLTEARRLWSEAGQRYAQALAIKGDTHEAAYNWGNTLNVKVGHRCNGPDGSAAAVVGGRPALRLGTRHQGKYARGGEQLG